MTSLLSSGWRGDDEIALSVDEARAEAFRQAQPLDHEEVPVEVHGRLRVSGVRGLRARLAEPPAGIRVERRAESVLVAAQRTSFG